MLYNSSTTVTTSYSQPMAEAFIAKGKNRLKQNGQEVYLNNNENFEIELFNPRRCNILAKIKINGEYIPGGGLVIRPGQRHFLDRYIDVARKFVFSTYEIESGNAAAEAAAALNGLVTIEFYDEKIRPTYRPHLQTLSMKSQPRTKSILRSSNVTSDSLDWMDQEYSRGFNSFNLSRSSAGDDYTTTSMYSQNLSDAGVDFQAQDYLRSATKTIETGRIEAGDASDQTLTQVDMTFSPYVTNVVTWQIKPKSQEPVEPSQLATYCTECGKKMKDTFKFCPMCGTKVAA